jgi:dephospho-CoA kinase
MTTDIFIPPGIKLIGIVGGIASGKSFVARVLEKFGSGRLDADGAGHEVLRYPEVEAALRTRWGDEVFTPDGRIDRRALAKRVFGTSATATEDLAYLEQLTHPRIADRLREQAEALIENGKSILILDAPVLLKAGWDRFCTHLLFVDSSLEKRCLRAAERGWKPGELEAREALQEPLAEKRRRADLYVSNDGTAEETESELARLWSELSG